MSSLKPIKTNAYRETTWTFLNDNATHYKSVFGVKNRGHHFLRTPANRGL